MGTNYYLHRDVCPHCGRGGSVLHIGKSSHGWTFSFRGYDADKGDPVTVKSADEWAELMDEHGSLIKDEYGDAISGIDFWRMWAKKRHEKFNHTEYVRKDPWLREHAAECWLDHEGNSFHGGEFS